MANLPIFEFLSKTTTREITGNKDRGKIDRGLLTAPTATYDFPRRALSLSLSYRYYQPPIPIDESISIRSVSQTFIPVQRAGPSLERTVTSIDYFQLTTAVLFDVAFEKRKD